MIAREKYVNNPKKKRVNRFPIRILPMTKKPPENKIKKAISLKVK